MFGARKQVGVAAMRHDIRTCMMTRLEGAVFFFFFFFEMSTFLNPSRWEEGGTMRARACAGPVACAAAILAKPSVVFWEYGGGSLSGFLTGSERRRRQISE